MDKIVAKIKELRTIKGYTLEEFSKKLGFNSPTGYRKIEAGETDLKIKHLTLIAEALEVELSDLLEITPKDEFKEKFTQQSREIAEQKEVISYLRKSLDVSNHLCSQLIETLEFIYECLNQVEKNHPDFYANELSEIFLSIKEKQEREVFTYLSNLKANDSEMLKKDIEREKLRFTIWKKMSPTETTFEAIQKPRGIIQGLS